MRIAQLAPLWKTVPPKQYGGTELVVSNLTEELVKQGINVTLFACGDSQTSAHLVKVIEKPMYDFVGGFSWNTIQPYEFLTYNEFFKRVSDFDIVHNHMGFHPTVFAQLLPIPMITTLHSSTIPDFPHLINSVKDNLYVSISNAQRSIIPKLNYIRTIYHGIETNKFHFKDKQDNEYLFFIGSLTPQKGIDIAVKAIHELGEKLIIAGEIRKEYEDFLNEKVFPYVDGKQIKFVGEIAFKQKCELYAHAKALLFPIQWNEAFGLVMVESLASGTPVVAYKNGSVPEIITNGQTGYIVENYEDFKKAIKNIHAISRKTCREMAQQRFDVRVMTKNYINLYKQFVSKKS